MYFIFKILFALSILTSLSFSNELLSKNLYDKNISINKGSYKILEFEKMIKSIKVSDQESIEVDFLDSEDKPLQAIKVFSKKLGHGNILITFYDASSIHIDINVAENLTEIIKVAKKISPKIKIQQTSGKIILTGTVPSQSVREKILDLFEKAGIVLKTDLVDLLELENPDKMIRIKLYAVEINNDKGLDLKNNWFVSSKNYIQNVDKDGLFFNSKLDPSTDDGFNESNNQRNPGVHDAIDGIMTQAVSLTGGLTGAANYLGKYFNVGVTLNYLASKGVANVLDETTLLTLENKKAAFLAGGTIYVKIQTTTAEGVPSTEVREISYGLQLDLTAKNIVNDNFISLDLITKSKDIDFSRLVDGIPSFTEKSITTNVVVGNNSTIVLGGLINRSNSDSVDKIPLLGDIPILGKLFTSKSFKEGKSELVFFITPEIVDARNNNQENLLNNKSRFAKKIDEKFSARNEKDLAEPKKDEIRKVEPQKNKIRKYERDTLSSAKAHELRVKAILGL